jgi:hypothetical protein
VSNVNGLSSSAIALGGVGCRGWWLVVEEARASRLVAGPFSDRVEADLAVVPFQQGEQHGTQAVFGIRRADGGLDRRPSPEDEAWLAHLADQLDGVSGDLGAGFSDDDPLGTLLVEVVAALSETGLPLYDATGAGVVLGGVCLAPQPGMGGILVAWRQHDRMSVDHIHGPAADASVQDVMNRALADVLMLRGFVVDGFGDGSCRLVRSSAPLPW